jgi:hypothetical protein
MTRRTNEQIISDLIEAGATTLAEAYTLNQSLTTAYKKFAGIVVDLRSRFRNSKDTAPDWRGQTQAYRDAVAKMYEASGVPADSVDNMQAAIRYHIGNALRERLSAEDLAAAGLQAESPVERARQRNQRAAASGDDLPEDEEEWFQDTITTLKSMESDHPEVVILDLRDDQQDVLPMLHKCLTIIQAAHLEGVTPQTKDACIAVLDQVLAEAAAFRAEAQQVAPAAEPAKRPRGRPRKQVAPAT